MLTKSVLALGSLSVIACAVLAPRMVRSASSPRVEPALAKPALDRTMGQIGLNGCDIDLRYDDTHHEEAQVFWKDNVYFAFQYDLWHRNTDALMIGNAAGDPGVLVKAGGPNSIVFKYDDVKMKVDLELVNALNEKYTFDDMEVDGEFDRLGLPVEPTWFDVRHPTDPAKRCVRVHAEAYGITYEFTLAEQ